MEANGMSEFDNKKAELIRLINEANRIYSTLVKIEAAGIRPEIVEEIRPLSEKGVDEQGILRALVIQMNEILPKIRHSIFGCVFAAPEGIRDTLSDYAKELSARINTVRTQLNANLLIRLPSYERQVVSALVRLSGLPDLIAELTEVRDYW